jgi:hypothetical protein
MQYQRRVMAKRHRIKTAKMKAKVSAAKAATTKTK